MELISVAMGCLLCCIWNVDFAKASSCKTETINSNGSTLPIIWDSLNIVSPNYPDFVQAEPMCLDQHKMTIVRQCQAEKWVPLTLPHCEYSQPSFEHSELCSFGYQTISRNKNPLCILLTERQVWQNLCLFDGSLTKFYDLNRDEKFAVLEFLHSKGTNEVWMPAKRNSTYGPLMWTLAGDAYGETVDLDDMNNVTIDYNNVLENGCLSALVASNLSRGYMQNCEHHLPIMCVYRQHSREMLGLGCPRNHYTTQFKGNQNYCYSVHHVKGSEWNTTVSARKNTENHTDTALTSNNTTNRNFLDWIFSKCRGDLFTMNSPHKTAIFLDIAQEVRLKHSDHCIFSVTNDNVYVTDANHWSLVVNNVSYVNWDFPILSGMYLTTNNKGKWNWINGTFNCILCQRRTEFEMPVLILNFDERKERLYLIVYNENFLWRKSKKEAGVKCFTNVDYELVKTIKVDNKKWSRELNGNDLLGNDSITTASRAKSKSIYKLEMYEDGAGYYWCEGHAVREFELVTTSKVVAFKRLKGEIFAALVRTECENGEKLYVNGHLKALAKEFREFLKEVYKNTTDLYDYRINIENIRVMQIEHIGPRTQTNEGDEKQSATILYHLTVSADNNFKSHFVENQQQMQRNQLKIYKMKQTLEALLKNMNSKQFEFLSLNSTRFCLPELLASKNNLSWMSAKIGENIAPNELCLLSSGLPVLRSCIGDFLYGGVWYNLTRQECQAKVSNITKNLYKWKSELPQLNKTCEMVANISQLLQQNASRTHIVPADLFYLGRVMHTVSKLHSKNSTTLLNQNETKYIFSIYNSLMLLNESTTRTSAALNSTNILLDAFDNIINGIPMDITSTGEHYNNLIVNLDDGTMAMQTPKLIVYVIDPFVKNVSGIALIKNKQLSDENNDFTDFIVKTLYSNQSSSDLLAEDGLEMAAYVPKTLLDRLTEMRNISVDAPTNPPVDEIPSPAPPIKIVIGMFYNDRLFQEFKNVTSAKSAGKVISVSIPGYGPNLPDLLPIFVKSKNFKQKYKTMCGYWDFRIDLGVWSHYGCEYIGKSESAVDPIVMCACSHLTHYSYLIGGKFTQSINVDEDNVVITKIHERALDMITLLGCSLSLLGILGIAITAIMFRTWREKTSSKVLLQLSTAIALQMIILCFVNTEYSAMNLVKEHQLIACIALGALLQYSILAAFSWMLITAYLQFMRYVKVLGPTRPTRFFLKSFIIGWAAPLVPVISVIVFDSNSFVESVKNSNAGGICYPSGQSLYWGLILPIGIITLANWVVFLLVIYNIVIEIGGKLKTNEQNLTLSQLRLSVFLFFLLGLSWVFGFFAKTNSSWIFSYLFCVTATIQGFVLFIYFIILDPSSRKMWRNFFTAYFWCGKKVETCK